MSLCIQCGNPIPDGAKFCPVCGTPVPAVPVEEAPAPEVPVEEAPVEEVPVEEEAPVEEGIPVEEEAPFEQEAPAGSWYQASEAQTPPPAAPVYAQAKPSIGSIFDCYRKAFAVLAAKPLKLWGLSLLYILIAAIISSLGSLVPIITIPIVLVLGLGFTGVLLKGYHGEDVNTRHLFQGFRKDEIIRNGAGMCWMELWTLIWGFVPVMNIIKAYSYSFTPYILVTDKNISATEALRKSMRMTDGYKGKMFGADVLLILAFIVAFIVLAMLAQISYIGWIFGIVCFLLYVAFILFVPLLIGLIRTAFFEEISKVHAE